jgi:TfuA protein
MNAVIFAGPSLTRDRIRAITDFRVEDPIRRGDLKRLSDYDRFVILDGEFGQSLSVSPKEILEVIDSGRTVIGASSMGALRASELDRDGMIGIGWVYRRFAQSRIRRDDEVALVFSPFDYSPVTVPMVSVEYWLEILDADRIISRQEVKIIRRLVGKIFFAQRTEAAVLKAVGSGVGTNTLGRMLEHTSGIPDIKALDAEEAIQAASDTGLLLSQKHDLASFQKGRVDPYATTVSAS